jgi:hypothetical protein
MRIICHNRKARSVKKSQPPYFDAIFLAVTRKIWQNGPLFTDNSPLAIGHRTTNITRYFAVPQEIEDEFQSSCASTMVGGI